VSATLKGWPALLMAPAIAMSTTSMAATIRVPEDQPTIQAGVSAAVQGDTVLVRCGTYSEHDIVVTASITLRSEIGDWDCVVIDGHRQGAIIHLAASDVKIEGFTLRGGSAPTGAGLHCNSHSGSVSKCRFDNNEAIFHGGTAGGVSLYKAHMSFVDCIFTNNLGGAIVAGTSTIRLSSCTFYGNFALQSEANSLLLYQYADASLENCILSFANGQAIRCAFGPPSTVELRCCDIYGNSGNWSGCIAGQDSANGNFSSDPGFCDAELGDWHLSDQSPCSPAHSPSGCGLIGALDVRCSTDVVAPVTWGAIKAIYK
jgi:hypothetical protein